MNEDIEQPAPADRYAATVAAPETHYAKSGDVHIAYQVSGTGPIDLVVVPGFVSHVELAREMPFTRWSREAETFARVIRFDKRGTGLSDRSVGVATLEQRMDDVRAVMDAVGIERAALWGISEGGPMCILFAATYPERTSALVLQASFACRMQTPDQPYGLPEDAAEALVAAFEDQWGTGTVLGSFFPSAMNDLTAREWFARYERNAASPNAMADILRMVADTDVRPILPTISIPTLVVHNAEDLMVPVEHGRYLAEHIPGARYVELPGADHITIQDGEPGVIDDIEEFLTGHRPAHPSHRVLSTVLFTDICGSTERASALGDRAWRHVLDEHDELSGAEIEHHRGKLIKTTGDGLLATFDGPARAVQCAVAIRDRLRPLGITLRAGVHTGEVEVRGTDVGGIAVHIGSRIAALAEPDEVMVSRTVTDLVAGSGLSFVDRGTHTLKGVPDEWRLFALSNSSVH
jgi:class 3 adenylate cyclase/pimeloyl-ACP methyl ester carboxylesterase